MSETTRADLISGFFLFENESLIAEPHFTVVVCCSSVMSDHQRCRSLLEAIQDKYECKEPLHIEIFLPKSAPGKTGKG